MCCMETDIKLTKKGDRVKKIFATHWGLRSYAHGEANIIQQATFFRRGVFEKVGGFNVNNRTCWDGELLVDMALAGARFKRTKEVFGAFRIYGDSITGSGRLRESLLRDEKRIKEKILGRSESKADVFNRLFYKFAKYISHPNQVSYKLIWHVSNTIRNIVRL